MSIEYLNLKGSEPNKLLPLMMKKIGKDFLLVNASSDEVDTFKKEFHNNFKKGPFSLLKYLIESGETKFDEDEENSKLLNLTRAIFCIFRFWAISCQSALLWIFLRRMRSKSLNSLLSTLRVGRSLSGSTPILRCKLVDFWGAWVLDSDMMEGVEE